MHHLVLELEEIAHNDLCIIRPSHRTRRHLDELSADPNPIAGSQQASLVIADDDQIGVTLSSDLDRIGEDGAATLVATSTSMAA